MLCLVLCIIQKVLCKKVHYYNQHVYKMCSELQNEKIKFEKAKPRIGPEVCKNFCTVF